jgi:hypothetical protein
VATVAERSLLRVSGVEFVEFDEAAAVVTVEAEREVEPGADEGESSGVM